MWSESHLVVSNSLQPHRLYSPWSSPGQNIGVGSLSLLQRIFPTQESNWSLLHCRQILYQLSHKGSPRILEWVAYPFSRGSSQPRNWTRVSCIAGRFFTSWGPVVYRYINLLLLIFEKWIWGLSPVITHTRFEMDNYKSICFKSFTSTLGLVATGLLLVNINLTSQCLGTYVLRVISFCFNLIYFFNLHVDKIL